MKRRLWTSPSDPPSPFFCSDSFLDIGGTQLLEKNQNTSDPFTPLCRASTFNEPESAAENGALIADEPIRVGLVLRVSNWPLCPPFT